MIHVSTRDLNQALAIVTPLALKAGTLPITSTVHLLPSSNKLALITTSMSAWLRAEVPMMSNSGTPDLGLGEPTPKSLGTEEVGTCIGSRQLNTLVSTLEAPDTQIALPEGNNKATVTSGRVKAALLCLPGEEFPHPASDGQLGQPTVLPAEVFCMALQSAIAFAATDTKRTALCSVLLDGDRQEVRFVATDTHTLFRRSLSGGSYTGVSPLGKCLIPMESATHVLRIVRALKALEVSLRVLKPETGGSYLVVGLASGDMAVTMTLRLSEEAYPNYERVIPTAHEREWTLDRKDALTAISRVSIAASDNANRCVLCNYDRPSSALITAESGTIGVIEDELEVAANGEPIEICFNAKLFKRCLDAMVGDGVSLRMTEPLRPSSIVPTDEPATDGWHVSTLTVLMPMQVV
ncbi:DNA polymerase III subunit beta [Armatimonas rosea]|uniref:DNA polymerase-3 subunit beta n=1 Tax=Armatimonas rosea TaxID=685828 RepID=A0A7W9SVV4_ARMRO|nr:DNA polymerase III subunit beta [Armatimonas rosea]MBB6053320.1 DNA polymerase-3 subunit beta [Armatimonas rosea]